MTDRILREFKQQIAGFKLIPSKGGCFEISVNGELIYSKLKTGEFPDEAAIVASIGKRL